MPLSDESGKVSELLERNVPLPVKEALQFRDGRLDHFSKRAARPFPISGPVKLSARTGSVFHKRGEAQRGRE